MPRQAKLVVTLTLSGALLCGCAGAVSDAYVIENDPGKVEHVDGSELGKVTLTEPAAKRLSIEVTPVEERGRRLVVPSSAIFVDPDGAWWVYTNPEPLSYVRHEVEIVREADGHVVLSSGPEAGTEVVTVGVPELYGVEAEVGH